MSFPMNLLCLKKGSEFAELWHAGILSQKQFTAKLKKKNVNAIQVAEARQGQALIIIYHLDNFPNSQKVTDHLVQTEESHHSLNLIQSSTMMLGASRILNYQAESALSETEKFLKDWKPKMPVEKKKKKKKRPDSPDDAVFKVPADPGTPDYSKNAVSDPKEITMDEDHILPPVPIEEQPGYFGGITTELLDEILRTDYRLFPTDNTVQDWGSESQPFRSIPDRTVPEADPTVEDPVIENGDTTGFAPPLVPGTPKRKPTSPILNETPKKPRISEDREPDAEPIPPEVPVERQVEPPTLDMSSLGSLRSSDIPAARPRRRRRLLKVDRHLQLSSETMRQRLANVYIETMRRRVDPRPRLDLFVTPCTQVARGKAWNAKLLLEYNIMTTEPIFRDDTSVPTADPAREPVQDQDTTGVSRNAPGTSRILPPGSVSVPPPESTGPTQTIVGDDLPLAIPRAEETPTEDQAFQQEPALPGEAVPSPERRNRPKVARRIIDDFEGTGARRPSLSSSDVTDKPNDSGSHDVTSQQIPVDEVMADLQRLWLDKPVVDMDDLCPVDETTRDEAAQIFALLLVLYKDKKILMSQDELWGRIIITKYSESDYRCKFCQLNSDIDSD